MKKLILASNNKHKLKEFREVFENREILGLLDIGFVNEIVEDGNSFEENSTIKAMAVQNFLKARNIDADVIADDSGLCVNALGGAPGIYSARYSGVHEDKPNREKLLKVMEGVTDRTAYFSCFLVLIKANGDKVVAEGRTYGEITHEERGDTSFGYDCLFYSKDLNKTFGEASADEKNSVSHRGRAIKELLVKVDF